ncbi:hypothetical protein BD324DRAFT_582622 [Kockovaella imperatae]|uniref:Mitochondrial import inner membrane translocase subunit TIM50 n=1 Tax=Kockovaella imperatae TaxID=4999 RepID=A0A1Y1UC40_9TREE|nr:hypothetical protein BD324DRAFT_582622 [Kockovaella imperatae]ORX35097.1 hypothetical protein BD324DRAFT_582622 [Kockovaella imperatae]
MLRAASSRLLASTSTSVLRPYRPISTTATLLKKKRGDDLAAGSLRQPPPPPPPPPSAQAKTSPSPSERPPPPPPSLNGAPITAGSGAPLTDPIVNRPAEPTSSSSSSTSPSASGPSTGVASDTAVDTNAPEELDLRDLPSLNIETVTESARIEERKREGEGSEGPKRTGAGRKQYVSSIERQRRMWLRYGTGGLVVSGIAYALFQGATDDGVSIDGQWKRFKASLSETFDVFNKPAFKTLLPDPLPPPHQRPYTLLVDLEGMLVSSTWDRQNGWKTAKRPGADYFLAYLSQFYEIVLFTTQPLYTAAPVAEKLDPYQAYIPYKLFRESTRTAGGKTVKDLSYLNRDLSKVILLDTDPEHSALQPENSVIIKPWKGNMGDRGLVEMIPFLESIGIFQPPDVRPILELYRGKDIPVEYAKKEAESKRQVLEEWRRQHPTNVHGGGTGMLSSLFGSVAAVRPGQQRPKEPMTYLEQKRAIAQRQYEEEQKYWRDHAEEFAKMIEEDKQRQLAEMKGSLWGFMTGAPGANAQAQAQAQGQDPHAVQTANNSNQ